MATCDLYNSCFFFNEQTTAMPRTTEYLRERYCAGKHFTECALRRIANSYGKDKVPKYLYPNDMFEILNFNLFEPQGGLDMFMKVVYPDGTSGVVKSKEIEGLIKAGKIVAFHCSEGWVEARRKQNVRYRGPERRAFLPY